MSALVKVNRRIAAAVGRVWPYRGVRAFDDYPEVVARYAGEPRGVVIVDVGAGHESAFASRLAPDAQPHIIGIDVAEAAMTGNEALSDRVVADVVRQRLPLDDEEIDLVTSRSVLEHLDNVEAFVAESARVLKPGGHFIHIFSTRSAPFAIVGRLLPHLLAQRLLYMLYPDVVGTQGFKTHYDHCSAAEMSALFHRHGFEIVQRTVSYRTS